MREERSAVHELPYSTHQNQQTLTSSSTKTRCFVLGAKGQSHDMRAEPGLSGMVAIAQKSSHMEPEHSEAHSKEGFSNGALDLPGFKPTEI